MTRPLRAVPEPQAKRQTGWSDAELATVEFPPPRWAVPGLISEGLNLLVGAPKIGKSWFSLGMAAAIAAGDPVLGTVGVEQGPVLYLALEDTGRRLQERRAIQINGGSTATPHLRMETVCPVWNAGGEAFVLEWLEANRDARLVIIDTFEKIRGRGASVGGSAYADDYLAAGRIKELADHYGVPILVVHHVRKAGAEDFLALVSGTNGIPGAADTILVLERSRGDADAVLHVTGRDVEETDYALSFDAPRGYWHKLDGPVDEHVVHDTSAQILRHLRETGGQKPAHIASALAINSDSVRQTCNRMLRRGQLTRDSSGLFHASSYQTEA